MRALIAGGGIGGLTAAIALRRAGFEVAVFEQAPALRERGAGLTLWSNAMRLLAALGLSEPLLAAGTPLERGEIRAVSGRLLAGFPLAELAERMGAPILGIHRGDLLAILAGLLDAACVHVESRLTGFHEEGGQVTACFADGRNERGDLLIGADGIHSRVREGLTGQPRRYCGYVGWQGIASVTDADLRPGLSTWSYGLGSQVGLIPVGGGLVFWFATITLPEDTAPSPSDLATLRRRFRGWHPPIPEILERADDEAVLRIPIYDLPPGKPWGRGRVTLLGDAAHATSPTLGQGACLAIESAVALAGAVRRAGSIEEALRGYERERQERTARIIDQAWHIGSAIQWRNPVACALRDLAVRLTPGPLHLRALVGIMEPGCRVDTSWMKEGAPCSAT